jgi:hypothetical protein
MTEGPDYASQLAEIGKTVIGSLIERGVSGAAAGDAAQQYIQVVSSMVTAARNFKTLANRSVPIEIGDIQLPEPRTIVTRQGNEWGKICLAKGEPLMFRFEYEIPGNPPSQVKGDFPV